MTDTDKLKRLAEDAGGYWYDVDIALGGNTMATGAVGSFIASFSPQAILALIAENERLAFEADGARLAALEVAKKERDEAVALLREWDGFAFSNIATAKKTLAFLARIDAANNTVA